MKANVRAIATAIVIVVVFTVLPIYGQRWIPAELQKVFTIQMGIDVTRILNTVAVGGAVLASLILLRGHLKNFSRVFSGVFGLEGLLAVRTFLYSRCGAP